MRLKSICVFCGSSNGASPSYVSAAKDLAQCATKKGIQLVYGGASVGLMGVLADTALAGGGRVVGVIPRALVVREIAHRGLTELHVVETMHDRKARMAELADAFVVLPGGLGTLEELFEVWTSASLGMHEKPVLVLDPDGFYAPLWEYLDALRDKGFVRTLALEMLRRVETVDEAFDLLAILLD